MPQPIRSPLEQLAVATRPHLQTLLYGRQPTAAPVPSTARGRDGGGGDAGSFPKLGHVWLTATADQAIADGGGPVEWATEGAAPAATREFAPSLPAATVTAPFSGVLQGTLMAVWDDYYAGGAAEIVINKPTAADETATLPALGTFTDRTLIVAFHGIDVAAGDEIEIRLPNASGAPATLTEAYLDLEIRQAVQAAPAVSEPELINATPSLMSWGNPDVNVPIPAEAEAGDLLILVGGGVHFASQPPTSIGSAGWTTLISSEPVSGSRSTVVGWKIHNGTDTFVKVEGGSSSSFVLCTWGKVVVFRGAKLGALARAFGSGTAGSKALTAPTYPSGRGRLMYGGGTDNATGPGSSSGGTSEAVALVSDGNSGSSARASTVVRWDPGGTDETYTFTIPNSTSYDVVVLEIVGEHVD